MVMNTILVQLMARGLKVCRDNLVLAVDRCSATDLLMHLGELVDECPADASTLARAVRNKTLEKYDRFLSEELLCLNYAASRLNTTRAWETLKQIVDR
jgi:hypothetical protein